MAHIVEREFEHAGYKCVVVFQEMGHRCGYVGVSKESKLYGKSYMDKLDIKMEKMYNKKLGKRSIISWVCSLFDDKKERVSLCLYFDVHGSLTYSGGGEKSDYPIESDLWWFGFDCAHAGDRQDYEYAMKLFPQGEKRYKDLMRIDREIYGELGNNDYVIRSEEYVAEECKRLAEQIMEYEKNETKS